MRLARSALDDIELGRLEEGMRQVQESLLEHEDARAKAFCACFLAIGAARQGRLLEAGAHMEAAKELDAHSIAIPKAMMTLLSCRSMSSPAPTS